MKDHDAVGAHAGDEIQKQTTQQKRPYTDQLLKKFGSISSITQAGSGSFSGRPPNTNE